MNGHASAVPWHAEGVEENPARVLEPSPRTSSDDMSARRGRRGPVLLADEVDVLGLPIHSITPDQLIKFLVLRATTGLGGYVSTVNLDGLRSATRSREFRSQLLAADVRVADGKPLLWASRLQGTPLPARVAGSDLINTLSRAIADMGQTVFLVGGNPGTAQRAADILCERSPHLKVSGIYCPPMGYEKDALEVAALRAALTKAKPHFVYIGLPFRNATALSVDLRRLLPEAWSLGLGVSFSFVAGEIARAPAWMQEVGLEWLHRLVQEPQRLSRRYLVDGLPFLTRLLLSSIAARRRSAA